MNQKEALDILKMGRNVFLTGSPGSGKTHTVNEYVVYLRQHGRPVPKFLSRATTRLDAVRVGGD